MRVAFGRKTRRPDNHHDPILVEQQEDHFDSCRPGGPVEKTRFTKEGVVYRPKTGGPLWGCTLNRYTSLVHVSRTSAINYTARITQDGEEHRETGACASRRVLDQRPN